MSHSVRRHLRLELDDYDRSIRCFLPAYEEMLSLAAASMIAAKRSPKTCSTSGQAREP